MTPIVLWSVLALYLVIGAWLAFFAWLGRGKHDRGKNYLKQLATVTCILVGWPAVLVFMWFEGR